MENFQVTDVVIIAIIIGLVKLATQIGMPTRLAPAVSVILGIAGGIVYVTPGDVKTGVIVGIIMGLSSVGLYSGTRNTIGK